MPLAKPTKPDAITAVPTPVPLRSDRANFAVRGDAMMGWFPTGIAGVNTTLTYFGNAVNFVEQEANEAEASATAAEASNVAAAGNAAAAAASAGATVWVTGSTYTAGVVRYSPTNFSTYRDTVGGLSSTDPASDTTGRWQSAMLPSAEAIALPAVMPTIAINALSGASNVSVQVTRAMEKYRYNRLGYIVADPAGVLGVDHDPVSKAPRGWKIDPQTVYLAMQSENIVGGWLHAGITPTAGARLGPDGLLSATKLQVNATGATDTRDVVATATQQYFAVTVYKGSGATEANAFTIRNDTTATNLASLTINYDTGAVSQYIGAGATTEPVPGGWLLRIPVTTGVTIGDTLRVYMGFTGGPATAGMHCYVAEPYFCDKPNAGYHPTAGSNITRPADVLAVTGPDFSDNYNQVEGTFLALAEVPVLPATARPLFDVSDGTANNRIAGAFSGAATTTLTGVVGGVTEASMSYAQSGTSVVMCASYKLNDYRLTGRGVTASTDTSATVPAVTQLVLGGAATTGSELGGWLKALYYYPRAVTAGESRALVTHA